MELRQALVPRSVPTKNQSVPCLPDNEDGVLEVVTAGADSQMRSWKLEYVSCTNVAAMIGAAASGDSCASAWHGSCCW